MDGFIDDEKFKDMIPIMTHGSQDQSGKQLADEDFVVDEELAKKVQRKETKSVIPKLEDEDRSIILPLIVKILQSKANHKKGAINKKSIHVRRNLIYSFYATLDPSSEFSIVIDQLLEPVGLSSSQEVSVTQIQSILSSISLNQYLTFVNQLEVMIKQMGILLRDTIPHLSTILIEGVIRLVKVFLQGDVEEQEQLNDENGDELDDGDGEDGEHDNAKGNIHFNARK